MTREGISKQLTHDGRSKLQAELSKGQDRIAYYEQCTQDEACTPSVIILDLIGRRMQTFKPTIAEPEGTGPCGSILGISWQGSEQVLAVKCHLTPSASAYMEIDLKTGKHVRDLTEFGSAPSPNGNRVAHVAPLVHFAPPYA